MQYLALSPLGAQARRATHATEGLSSLNGTTIGQLWNHMFRGDEVFGMAREGLRHQFPTLRFLDHREFGNIHGPDEVQVISALPRLLKEKGCSGVISGIGG